MNQRYIRFAIGLIISAFIYLQDSSVQRAKASENFLKRLFYVSPIEVNITREELQRRILAALTRENTVKGKIVSRRTAFFEGCVLVRRLDRFKNDCQTDGYWLLDTRIDLGYLETHPADVRE